MAGVVPLLDPDPTAGQVVVTRFECGTLLNLITVLVLHIRLKIDVRRQARGFIDLKLIIQWRRRTVLSVSFWENLDSVYSMGSVRRHIAATRLPGQLGVDTTCGIFCYVGDWRRVMYRGHVRESRSPLTTTRQAANENSSEGGSTDGTSN